MTFKFIFIKNIYSNLDGIQSVLGTNLYKKHIVTVWYYSTPKYHLGENPTSIPIKQISKFELEMKTETEIRKEYLVEKNKRKLTCLLGPSHRPRS
jgi:hypothetical protein